MSSSKKLCHLTLKHNQWQFKRAWPTKLQHIHGKWHIRGLATGDVNEACRQRDDIVAWMDEVVNGNTTAKHVPVSGPDPAIIEENQNVAQLKFEHDMYLAAEGPEAEGRTHPEEYLKQQLTDAGVLGFTLQIGTKAPTTQKLTPPTPFETKVWAVKQQHDAKTAAVIIGDIVPYDLHLDEFCKKWPVAPPTEQRRRRQIKQFFEWLGTKDVTVVTKQMAAKYIGHCEDREQAANTIHTRKSSLQCYYHWLIEHGYFNGQNPFQDIKIRSKKKKQRIAWTTDQVFENIEGALKTTSNCGPQLYIDIFILAALTGMRPVEISGLRVKNIQIKEVVIDENSELIPFIKCPRDVTKTAAGEREFPVHSQARDIILRNIANKEPHDLVFEEFKGDNKLFSQRFMRLLHKTNEQIGREIPEGKKLDFYSFRHFFYTQRQQATVSQNVLNDIIGHENEGLQGTYGHGFTDEQKLKVVEAARLPDDRLEDILNQLASL